MDGTTRLKIQDINPNLVCTLCKGYFVDATTIIECLHSFCRTCIVTYLKTSKSCPTCDTVVHKTRPHENIRSDLLLQDLVYKLVPGLYKDEMRRRREFYTCHYEAAPKRAGEERGDEMGDRFAYTEEEIVSLSLYLMPRGADETAFFKRVYCSKEQLQSRMERRMKEAADVRYLQCKAAVSVGLLKRFLKLKYGLPHHFEIEMFYNEEALRDSSTLCDIAYSYNWRRRDPMCLTFCVCTTPSTKPKQAPSLLEQLRLNVDKEKTYAKSTDKNTRKRTLNNRHRTPKLAEITALENVKVKEEIFSDDVMKKQVYTLPVDEMESPSLSENTIKIETGTLLSTEVSAKSVCSYAVSVSEVSLDTDKDSLEETAVEQMITSSDESQNVELSIKDKLKMKMQGEAQICKVELESATSSPQSPPPKRARIDTGNGVAKDSLISKVQDSTMDELISTPSASCLVSRDTLIPTIRPVNGFNNHISLSSAQPNNDKLGSPCNSPDTNSILVNFDTNIVCVKSEVTETSGMTQSLKPCKSLLGKRPASNPVLIAPAPAKIPALLSSNVDIRHVVKKEITETQVNGMIDNSNPNNMNVSNGVSLLPAGLPTPSPSPVKTSKSKSNKSSKSSKRYSPFTVANLLDSPQTPKRKKVCKTPAPVTRLKPPVLRFISPSTSSVSSSASMTSSPNTPAQINQQPLAFQTGYGPTPRFVSPLMLSQQQQVLIAHNNVQRANLQLAQSLRVPHCGPLNTVSQRMLSNGSLVASTQPSSLRPLTLSLPPVGNSSMSSLSNMQAKQTAFFPHALSSSSQLFTSQPSSMTPLSFRFPALSQIPSTLSFTAISTQSTSSFVTSKSSSLSYAPPSTSISTTSSQAKALLATKLDQISSPSSKIPSPPLASSASPTLAAVPSQQSQTPNKAHSTSQYTNIKSHSHTELLSRNVVQGCNNNQTMKTNSIPSHHSSLLFANPQSGFLQLNKSKPANPNPPGPYVSQNCLTSNIKTKRPDSVSNMRKKGKHRNANPLSTSFSPVTSAPHDSTPSILCTPKNSNQSNCGTGSIKATTSPATALAQLSITSPISCNMSVPTSLSSDAHIFTFPRSRSSYGETAASHPARSAVDTVKKEHVEVVQSELEKSSNHNLSKPIHTGSSGIITGQMVNGTHSCTPFSFAPQPVKPKSLDHETQNTPSPCPISPTGRSNHSKSKKKIAEIADTLHKRYNESHSSPAILHSVNSGCLTPKTNKTNTMNTDLQTRPTSSAVQSSGSSSFDSQNMKSSPSETCDTVFTSRPLCQQNLPSCAVTSTHSLLFSPLIHAASGNTPFCTTSFSKTSPIVLDNSSQSHCSTSISNTSKVSDSSITVSSSNITSARHELPGRILSLNNLPLTKSKSSSASRVEAKRPLHSSPLKYPPTSDVRQNSVTAVTASSTPTIARESTSDDQPLNLVKRDTNLTMVGSNML